VTAPPGVETERVGAWLAAHASLEGPLSFTRIGEGQSNLTFLVADAAGRQVVLRRPPLGEILASAHDVVREHRILEALATAGARAPRPIALCEDRDITGAPFYAMEYVEGETLVTTAAAQRLSAEARTDVGRELARTLAEFHSLDIDEIGLSDFRRPESLASRQLRRWHRQWEGSKTRELPVIDRLAQHFEARLPEEDSPVLVHGDYHLGNTLIDPGGSIRAVLDWELCSTGDALADVGLMVAYWGEFGTGAAGDDGLFREPVTSLPGFLDADALALEYARASQRPVDDLGFWVAFAYWKVAIIVEGVYRRWLNDPANGDGAGSVKPAVARLAGLAESALETRWAATAK
jgi:aminoglycoside phosphotransferase (APT) family kinase protein